MLGEVAQALRALRRSPGFASIAVVTLALGIGTSATVFSVIDAVVLRPLPYPEPDRLVDISHMTRENRRLLVPWHDVAALRAETGIFEDVAFRMSQPGPTVLSDEGASPSFASALGVSHDYLATLGVEPVLGRNFVADDPQPPQQARADPEEELDPVAVILTHGLWVRAFGADSTVLERTISFAGTSARVVGVLAPDFRLLHERLHRWVGVTSVELFAVLPDLGGFERPEGRQGRSALVLARLREGIDAEAAQAAVDGVASRLREEVPAYRTEDMRFVVYPLHRDLTEAARPIMLVLVGGVVFLMLLVCTNVANLVLVRGHVRSGVDAVRAVIGCGSPRLIREKLLEGGAIALLGGVLGVTLTWVGIRAIAALAPRSLPLIDRVQMDLTALAFCFSIALLTVVVAGLLPALQVLRLDLVGIVGSNGRGGSGRGRRRLMGGMVISELALSMVLLSGATIMVRSLFALANQRVGFDAEEVVTFDLVGFGLQYRAEEARRAFAQGLEARLLAIPGIEVLGRSSMPPLSNRVNNRPYGRDAEDLERAQRRADLVTVNRSYFDAMGTRLLVGRMFNSLEMAEPGQSVIVGETLARATWPGEDPIGKRLVVTTAENEKTVIGVVESVLMRGHGQLRLEAIYQPEVFSGSAYSYVLRSSGAVDDLAPAIREAVRSLDPALLPYGIERLSERVAVATAPTRFVVFIMSALAVIALLVAVGGLFAVVSYAVRTRTPELGIRMALGADRRSVTAMILRQAGTLTALGVVLGLIGVFYLSRFLAVIAYGTSVGDPLALTLTTAVLAGATTLACYAPARWASGIDPVETLRQ